MEDFDRLGAFYLGKVIDPETGAQGEELVLYDSGDLTTHAVIIGMTGSGKTGLGIGMLEEAALDRIPVIAIDPKGDLGNVMLAFPGLEGASFRPWVNPQAAAAAGKTVDELAEDQAALWRKGLADWGQSPDRIRRFRETVETAIYTPGSSAGIPVSVLRTFASPPAAIRDDTELFNERIAATATGVLALLGIDADPLTSREHILVSTILKHAWEQERGIDLPGLIHAIQAPPVEKVGVMAMDQFYPASDRMSLAMQLNNLLAAPGFDVWMQGVPLDAQGLFYTPEGKPRLSVLSIAHLNDAERMFFVTMLLTEIVAWMRRQPGTGSLRAVLYMDEIFGFLPPTANPPSKALFLTLLKQARAYGLGLVLATQNPVDLDYKALSNAGTWFLGRLQTERDKARVMEGLEGAGAGAAFDRGEMEKTLAGLGKRRFLLHNVHEDAPVLFGTRWVMSYLAGPFTRDQIRRLMADRRPGVAEPASPPPDPVRDSAQATADADPQAGSRPVLPSEARQVYLPRPPGVDGPPVYQPCLLGVAKLAYQNARHKVATSRNIVACLRFDDGPVPVDWARAELLPASPEDLEENAAEGARYAPPPGAASNPKSYGKWEKRFKTWLRNEQPLVLLKSPRLGMISEPGETEGEFRARLQVKARELRDAEVAKLRAEFDKKIRTVEKRVLSAQQRVDKEQTQVVQSRLDTALSVGTAILGAFMGRKRSSMDSADSALRKASRMRKESSDAALANEALAEARAELKALNDDLETRLKALSDNPDALLEELEPVTIKAKSTDIVLQYFGLAWKPAGDAGPA